MNRKTYLILLSIILLSLFLRLYNLRNRGLFFWDEGNYMWESLGFVNLHNFPGLGYTLAKPGHTFLIGLGCLLFGFNDYVGSLINSLFGVFTVFLVFIFGKKFFNERTGVFASSFLAVSSLHIIYSRSALPEIDSTFFYLLGTYFYFLSRENLKIKYLIISSLSLGFSLTCNFRWIFIPIIFFCYELHLYLSKRKFFLKRFFLFCLFFLLPFFFFQMISIFFQKTNVPSYFSNLKVFLGINVSPSNLETFINQIFFYSKFILNEEGLIIFSILSFGIFYLLFRDGFFEKILLLHFLIPFLLFSYNSVIAPRVLSITLPFTALIIGKTLSSIHYKKISIFITLLIVFYGINNSIEFLSLSSGYRKAMEYIIKNGGRNVFSTMTPITASYLGSTRLITPPGMVILKEFKEEISSYPLESLEKMKIAFQKYNFRFLLIDWQKHCWYYNSIKEIEQKYKPVYETENNCAGYILNLYENFSDKEERIKEILKDKSLTKIKIYDLKNIFGGKK